MAKKSKIARNEQRRATVARYAERRAELKRLVKSPHTEEEGRAAAVAELRCQPRDAPGISANRPAGPHGERPRPRR